MARSEIVNDRPTAGLDPRTRSLVVVLVFGAVLPLVDTTVVNIALDRLSATFQVAVGTVQWVVTVYAVAAAVAIPLTGWLSRRHGARAVWLSALLLFLAGSAACGAAWNIQSLIAFRVVQGIGGGMTMPVLQTLLMRSAGPEQARRAMAAIGVPAVLAPVLGPLAGGLLLDHLGWRSIFLINVPICLVALALARRRLPATPGEPAGGFDVTGLVLLGPALAALVYGLSRAGDGTAGGAGGIAVPLAAGLALLTCFVAHAMRQGGAALVDPSGRRSMAGRRSPRTLRRRRADGHIWHSGPPRPGGAGTPRHGRRRTSRRGRGLDETAVSC